MDSERSGQALAPDFVPRLTPSARPATENSNKTVVETEANVTKWKKKIRQDCAFHFDKMMLPYTK